MAIRAVLFDVGGPIDTEVLHEQMVDAQIIRALAQVGVTVDDAALREASDWAVASFAPSAYAAMIWRLAGGDPARAARAQHLFQVEYAPERASRGIEVREGIPALLAGLHGRGLLLGLAANQFSDVIDELDRHGVGRLFSHREVTGHHGFRKPDVRLFLRACADLDVEPSEVIMVGDRIDNDIAPARLLGMRAVLYRTGRHISQQPRSLEEVPDVEVRDVPGLAAALDSLLADG